MSDESRERTLQGQAKLIGHLFEAAGGRELVLPESMTPYCTRKYAVLFQDGTLLAASSGVTDAFHPIDPGVSREFFSYALSVRQHRVDMSAGAVTGDQQARERVTSICC